MPGKEWNSVNVSYYYDDNEHAMPDPQSASNISSIQFFRNSSYLQNPWIFTWQYE